MDIAVPWVTRIMLIVGLTVAGTGCGFGGGNTDSEPPEKHDEASSNSTDGGAEGISDSDGSGTLNDDSDSSQQGDGTDEETSSTLDPSEVFGVEAGASGDVAAGTDSAIAAPAEQLTPEIRQLVEDFGQLYLSFDHEAPTEERVTALLALAAPEIGPSLVAPLPPALLESLTEAETVIEVELQDVESVGDGAYIAAYEQTTSSDDDSDGQTQTKVLTIVINEDGLVSDVR